MPIYVRDGGLWKPDPAPIVRDAGIWKTPSQVYTKDAGVWKPLLAVDPYAGLPAVAPTFHVNRSSGTDSSSYSWTSNNIGAFNADKYVLVVAIGHSSGAANGVSGIVINGGSSIAPMAQQLFYNSSAANRGVIACAMKAVSTGSSITVAANFITTQQRAAISIFSLLNVLEPGVVFDAAGVDRGDTATAAGVYTGVSLNAPTGSFVIGAHHAFYGATGVATWTGVPEKFAEFQVETSTRYYAAANVMADGGNANLDVGFTHSQATNGNGGGLLAFSIR